MLRMVCGRGLLPSNNVRIQSTQTPFSYTSLINNYSRFAYGKVGVRQYAAKRPTVVGTPLNAPRAGPATIPRHIKLKATREGFKSIKKVGQIEGPSVTVVLIGWVIMSLTAGAMSMSMDTDPDQTALLLARPERLRNKLLSKSLDLLERELKIIMSCTEYSDDVKRLLLQDEFYADTLLTYCTHPGVNVEIRNYAAHILEVACRLPEMHQTVVLERGFHLKIIEALTEKDPSLYVKKQLATALCNFAIHSQPNDEGINDIALALGQAGVVKLLDLYHDNTYLRRRSQETAMERVSATCVAYAETKTEDVRLAGLTEAEWAQMHKYAALDAKARQSFMYEFKSSLVESGVLMYFHTAAGGLVWGVAESIRAKKPWKEVAKYGLRTSLVTCLVPIYFVGASVTIYNYARKQCEDSFDIMVLNSSAMMTLIPWYFILPKVERFSPFWIGGHVVGFVSFFCYLLYTNADNLQNDNNLKYRDDQYRRWKARQGMSFQVPAQPKADN
ncbi:hypothetical protein SARC_04970 [Sphaeroforma arctica JP610]|uniref:Armadillo repeat-containing domain-containing protein n=1 Tax=Sphaeroforma arctica JP610 TaxID=667725 RepID=A0A0L0G1Q4_9EUKA|nr:hypothetical protein SARC_04970 [Sphaeroforma arctica JP610]KNC82756.1 hypothetical protein SARC_04970 [Sphaeroforma arctica JP610]|eukprot:XP_014156658.1 hypothetical protein SARC_04970 [Sphaeroforma arctica JP610]